MSALPVRPLFCTLMYAGMAVLGLVNLLPSSECRRPALSAPPHSAARAHVRSANGRICR
jgi:hypothetical protein